MNGWTVGSLHRFPVLVEPVSQLRDAIALRSSAALVNYLPLLQDVKSVEIGAVRGVGRVLHAVHHHRAAGRLLAHQLRGAQPLLQAPVPGDLVGRVGARPAVGGVRLLDVHQHGVGDVRVALHHGAERLEARHERRSGAAAEVEDERSAVPGVVEDAGAPLVLQLHDLGVGRAVAEARRFQKVHLVAVPHRLEGLQAEEAVGVGHAQGRIVGVSLPLLHPEENPLPDAEEVQQPEHERCQQEAGQQDQADHCVLNGFHGVHDQLMGNTVTTTTPSNNHTRGFVLCCATDRVGLTWVTGDSLSFYSAGRFE